MKNPLSCIRLATALVCLSTGVAAATAQVAPLPSERRTAAAATPTTLPTVPATAVAAPRVGLAAWAFATDEKGPAKSVALMWDASDKCDRFELGRSTKSDGPFERIYSGNGKSFSDHALAEGTHYYRLTAHRAGGEPVRSNVAHVTTSALPTGLQPFSNQVANTIRLEGQPLVAKGVHYRFETDYENRALTRVRMKTSTDGKTWTDAGVVMDRESHPDLADCKFESGTTFYDERHDQIVWWCHWELSGPRYGHGKAMVATAKPGEKFSVRQIYNPLGVQVRDMSVFVDDDGQGYLAAASNMPGQGANATLYLFRLNETYDDAVEIVAKVMENGYREAPHIVKRDGFYYLFFSQAAGWHPSRGGYLSARSLSGPWSEPRSIGNASTFSSQSGAIIEFGPKGHGAPVMMGNRWIRAEGSSPNSALPVQFANGFAFFDYAPVLLTDAAKGLVVPVQMGRLLSQDRRAQASIPGKPGHEVAKAFDGDYDTSFQSDQKEWPFTITTDLGTRSEIRNVQVSWYLHKGSEAFYTYTIEGSDDGKSWDVFVDRRDASSPAVNKTFGFSSDVVPAGQSARYVRLTVQRAHLHNNPNNWYPPTVYEMKVFGEPAQ